MATRLTLTGDDRGTAVCYPLKKGLNPVGSDPSNTVLLNQNGVSRFHALLIVEGQTVQVVDQNSKNGTFVNAERVRLARATVGDEIWIGPAELHLEGMESEEIDLAFELTGELASPGSHTTENLRPSRLAIAGVWTRAIALFAERIADASHFAAAAALDELSRHFAVDSGCLYEITGEGEMVATVADGKVSTREVELLRERLLSHKDESFASDSRRTLLARPHAGLAIILTGDFADRQEIEPLLAALLSVYESQRRGEPTSSRESYSAPGLIFPSGYIQGQAPATRDFHHQMASVAATDLPVLVCGETGAGKEMIARGLHLSSSRRDGPFVAINCAALPVDLLEAELFGIGKGVATGVDARIGKFREAAGGTLFLDEIGEMPDSLQAKLLRALQEHEISPVGGKPVTTDFRLLAATNANISQLIDVGRFRRDLFFRLAGSVLEMPPLRERREDIPVLIEHLLRSVSHQSGKAIRGITVAAQAMLVRYDWPGNIRELEHEVRRLAHLCAPGQAVAANSIAEHIRREVDAAPSAEPMPDRTSTPVATLPTLDLAALERLAIDEALKQSEHNQTEAAELLGISRWALLRRIKRLES